jgi:hypothetical protein
LRADLRPPTLIVAVLRSVASFSSSTSSVTMKTPWLGDPQPRESSLHRLRTRVSTRPWSSHQSQSERGDLGRCSAVSSDRAFPDDPGALQMGDLGLKPDATT